LFSFVPDIWSLIPCRRQCAALERRRAQWALR
jgi:hypothetical protein